MAGGSPERGQAETVRSGDRSRSAWSKWMGVLPFVLLVILAIVLHPVAQTVPKLSLLASTLSTGFVGVPSLMVAYLAAKVFFRTGRVMFLWLGASFLILAFIGVVVWLPASNARVTIASVIVFLTSLGEVISIIFALRDSKSSAQTEQSILLPAVYGGGFLLLVLVSVLTLIGVIPPFFNPQTGNTVLRQATWFASAGLFAAAGAYYLIGFSRLQNSFSYWLSLGLLLAATSSAIGGFSLFPDTVYTWLVRTALYVAGFYWLVAIVNGYREARAQHVPVAEVIAAFFRETRESYQRVGGEASEMASSDRSIMSASRWVGVAPLLMLLLVLPPLVRSGGPGFVSFPALLFAVTNIFFVCLLSFVVAYQVSRSFAATGEPQLVWLGGGVLIFGIGTLFATMVTTRINAAVTAHNTGALLGAVFLVVGALMGFRGAPYPKGRLRHALLWSIYSAGAAAVLLVFILSLRGMTPVFFLPGVGGTPLRQIVLNSAIALFALSGLLLLFLHLRTRTVFLYWYSLGVILISLGLFVVSFVKIPGDIFAWLGRGGQYIGSVYLVIAVFTAVREARSRHMPVEHVIAEFGKQAAVNYRLLVNSASDAIIGVDGLGRIFAFNPAAEKMFGYLQSETIGQPFFDLIGGPEEADSYRKAATTAGPEGRGPEPSATVELKARRRNGEEFPVELTLVSRRLVVGWLPTTTTTTLIIRDITERKKAEETLRQSERHLAEAQHTAHVGSWEWDLKTGEMHWSDEMFRIVGFAPQSFTPALESAVERMHPDDRKKVQEQLDELMAKGTAIYEHRVVLSDGSIRDVSTNSIVTYDEGGRPKSVAGTLQDVTERKKVEAERDRLASFPEVNPSPIVELDASGNIIYMNPAARSLFPDMPAQGSGHPFLTGSTVVIDRLKAEHLPSVRQEVAIGGAWYEQIVFRVPGSQNVRLYSRDITERKQAEEALRQSEERFFKAFHLSPVGMTIARLPEGRWVDANDSFLRMMEYTREEVIGHTSAELNMFSDFKERPQVLGAFLEKGRMKDREMAVRTKTGKLLTVLSSNEKITLNGQDYAVSIILDITERKKAEQIKDEFIGMVSHELKTPLTVIMSALGVLQSEGLSREEVRELLGHAVSGTESMAGIVENLLEQSRSRAGRLAITPGPADIARIIGEVTGKLQGSSAVHRLTADVPAGLPAIRVDTVRVERVLHNLVENAIKYSPHGGEVRVFARQGDGALVVGVSDEGPGISPENQARLFQSFEQLGETTRRAMQGVGLGLKVCRTLVEAHGGRIWVESAPGKGATFLFTLPLDNQGEVGAR